MRWKVPEAVSNNQNRICFISLELAFFSNRYALLLFLLFGFVSTLVRKSWPIGIGISMNKTDQVAWISMKSRLTAICKCKSCAAILIFINLPNRYNLKEKKKIFFKMMILKLIIVLEIMKMMSMKIFSFCLTY